MFMNWLISIKMRAVANVSIYSSNCYTILSRLYETLAQKNRLEKLIGVAPFFNRNGKKSK